MKRHTRRHRERRVKSLREGPTRFHGMWGTMVTAVRLFDGREVKRLEGRCRMSRPFHGQKLFRFYVVRVQIPAR